MKKIIVYGIVIACSVLLVSNYYTAMAYQDSQKGYKYSVPDIAAEVEVDSEGEVQEFDREEWRDHVGYESEPDELFSGDADKVGARSKSEVLDFERRKDEEGIPFFATSILEAPLDLADLPTANNLYDVCDQITGALNDLTNLAGDAPIIIGLQVALQFSGWHVAAPGSVEWWAWQNMTLTNNAFAAYSFDSDYVKSKYNPKVDGTLMHRDLWWYTSEEYKKNPDVHRDKVPYMEHPEDWKNTADTLAQFKAEFLGGADDLINLALTLNESINLVNVTSPTSYATLQTNIVGLFALLGYPAAPAEWLNKLHWLMIDAALNPTGENWLQVLSGGQKGLYAILSQLALYIPEKFGLLWQFLFAGLPIYTPSDKFLKEMVEEYDIDGKTIEYGVEGLGATTPIIGDVKVKGNAIIVSIEYADPNEIREDFSVEFHYGGSGSQGLVVFKGSKIFYKQDGYPSSLEQKITPSFILIFAIVGLVGIAAVALYIRNKLKQKLKR